MILGSYDSFVGAFLLVRLARVCFLDTNPDEFFPNNSEYVS